MTVSLQPRNTVFQQISQAKPRAMNSAFRPSIQQMAGYVPGEQPQQSDWTKLNTNENPYPPSPRAIEAITCAAQGRLNVYPDPNATAFREVAAELYGVSPDWILPANGSDECLTIIVRSCCDAGDVLAYPCPGYVLYETLAQIQGCGVCRVPLNQNWQWDSRTAQKVRQDARLCCVPNPNSPTGTLWTPNQLTQLLPDDGVLAIDQAYADFCAQPTDASLLSDPRFDRRVIMTRTLSKSYSLAGIRFGFAIAPPVLVDGMRKVKDSYNCDAIAIAAATAALEDQDWMLRNRDRILKTRTRLVTELGRLGFTVHPSEANFVWTSHDTGLHKQVYEGLKEQRVLVRYMTFPSAEPGGKPLDGLRITVGTDEQVDRLLEAVGGVAERLSRYDNRK
jgi:histidinol-phosphate aminotransferase